MHLVQTLPEPTVRAALDRQKRGTVRMLSPAERGFEERVALMACAFAKGNEEEVLAGLTEGKRGQALRVAREVAQLSPTARRARIGQAFSDREEALERSRRLVDEASPAMRVALRGALPPYLRPQEDSGAFGVPTAMQVAFAARLVKEATR